MCNRFGSISCIIKHTAAYKFLFKYMTAERIIIYLKFEAYGTELNHLHIDLRVGIHWIIEKHMIVIRLSKTSNSSFILKNKNGSNKSTVSYLIGASVNGAWLSRFSIVSEPPGFIHHPPRAIPRVWEREKDTTRKTGSDISDLNPIFSRSTVSVAFPSKRYHPFQLMPKKANVNSGFQSQAASRGSIVSRRCPPVRPP